MGHFRTLERWTIIRWIWNGGDGFLQSLFIPAGIYTYSVIRFLNTEILSLPELLPLFLVVQDDDLGLTTKTIGGTNACPAESDLPAWIDKRHQMFLNLNIAPLEGHRGVTISDFSALRPIPKIGRASCRERVSSKV